MPKYVVAAIGRITLITEIEADSPAQAKAKAVNERQVTGLVHGAQSDSIDEAWVTTGELDCCPELEDVVDVSELH